MPDLCERQMAQMNGDARGRRQVRVEEEVAGTVRMRKLFLEQLRQDIARASRG